MATTDWQRLPFEEQIRYFGEKLNVPTDSYRDISGAEHDAAFVVAGAKGAVLNDLRKAVDRAIAEGTTLEQFRKEFEDVVQRTGWAFRGGSAWRSQVIWDTNLRTSYAAGRHEQMQAVATTRPYWQWRHGGSAHPRPQHLALDGKVFRHDDPFWGGFGTPPQGWNCRCQLFTLSDRDLERRGLTVDPGPQLGDRLPIPDLPGQTTAMNPPAGWGHIHGSSTPESRARLLDNVTRRLDPAIAAQVRREAERYQPNMASLDDVLKAATTPEDSLRATARWVRANSTGAPVEAQLHGMAEPEQFRWVEYSGRRYYYLADNIAPVARTLNQVAGASIPERLNQSTQAVYFSSQPNKTDAYWQEKYNMPNAVSLATGGGGNVVVYRSRSLTLDKLAHEMGHNLAREVYQGTALPPPESRFAQAAAQEPPPTQYAKVKISEDFAESVSLYVDRPEELRRIAPRRFEVLQDIMGGSDG